MIIVYLWPNGTWCEEGELESHLSWMSDDFETLHLTIEQYEQFVNTH